MEPRALALWDPELTPHGAAPPSCHRYAHIWAWFRSMGHILFFMIWCMSHLISNEVKEVMKSYGTCPEGQVRLA